MKRMNKWVPKHKNKYNLLSKCLLNTSMILIQMNNNLRNKKILIIMISNLLLKLKLITKYIILIWKQLSHNKICKLDNNLLLKMKSKVNTIKKLMMHQSKKIQNHRKNLPQMSVKKQMSRGTLIILLLNHLKTLIL